MSGRSGRPPEAQPTIGTSTGRLFMPLAPDPGSIAIEDIATGLAQTCRFSGQTLAYYSVAQHSVEVARRLERDGPKSLWGPDAHGAQRPELLKWGLLHDAAEAYMFDAPRPIRDRVLLRLPDGGAEPWRMTEIRILRAVARAFRLGWPGPWGEIARVDDRLLATEARDLFGPSPPAWAQSILGEAYAEPILALGPAESRELFLGHFRRLFGEAA